MKLCRNSWWAAWPALFGLTGVAVVETAAEDWPRFRGPNGTGIGTATNLPVEWRESDYAFRVRLPGGGHSSPVVVGNRLFLTVADREFTVVCLAADTGQTRWQRGFPLPAYVTHRNNALATSTPAADEERIYVTRVEDDALMLTALTHAGEAAWSHALGPFDTQHGLGHSPIVVAGQVILANDQDLAGRVVAFETSTGKLLWEVPRSPGRADYSTPCVITLPGGESGLLLNTEEDGISAVGLADGRLHWRASGALKMRSVSSPVIAGGLVLGTCGSGGGGNYLVAVEPPGDAGGPPRTVYEIRRSAPYVPTPLAVGGLVFLWSDAGIVTCIVAATGEALWQERVGGDYFASPVLADGKVINLSTRGEVVLLAAERQFRLLGRNPLGEPGNASPAVAGGRLYVRTLQQIVSIKARTLP